MTNASTEHYMVVPKAAHESWDYLPLQFTGRISAGSYLTIVRDPKLYQFGVLSSSMHMAWVKYVLGKLHCQPHKSHTPTIRNFPWPIRHTQAQLNEIEARAGEILAIRAQYAHVPLSDLYNPYSMPTELYRAHFTLDKAADKAYDAQDLLNDADRVSFLCNLDRQIANFLVIEEVFPMAVATAPAESRESTFPFFDLVNGRPHTNMA